MDVERKRTAFGQNVEEFYWNGRMIVYIDNRLTGETFDEAVSRLEAQEWNAGADGREMESRQEHSRMLSEHRHFASQ